MSGTLMDYGVKYREIPLKKNTIDTDKVRESISENTKMLMIQRSTGYSDRESTDN